MSLKATQIKKTFTGEKPIHLLKGIDLSVAPGETCAIMGRSGEGKSTLLHILGTLDSPTEGTLEICGQVITSDMMPKVRARDLGFVFQAFHLLEDYTVLENALMPARIARQNTAKGSAAYKRAHALLCEVGLESRLNHFGKHLSGGEKQRVAIARALCNDPKILFADEPSGNLDKKTAEGIHHILLNFAKEHQKSLIIVTHDLELAQMCDTLKVLNNGVLEDATR